MQDLLSGLPLPILIGLIILVLLALVAVVFLARRRRQGGPPGEGAALSLDGPVDYTSLPIEDEPRGWRERFARLSLAGKILAVLVPLLAILGLLVLVLTLQGTGEPPVAAPTPVPVTLAVADAAVIRPEPLTVDISVTSTGIADGERVTAQILEDGQPFAWLNAEQAVGTVRRNRAEIQALRAPNAPTPTEGRRYTVVVRGPGDVLSSEVDLVIPAISGIADAFYGKTPAAAAPTATSQPTATSAPAAEPSPTAEAAPEPSPTAAVALPEGPPAGVSNGGNVRRLPIILGDNVIGGVNAGEQVQLIERTPNGEWYRVRTARDEVGWVSATLISVPAGTNIPVANVVTVFVGGPMHERPDSSTTEVDRVNQGEVVELLQRSAAGDWYEVNNVRGQRGWVEEGLLGIPEDVAAAVPVAP